MRILLAEDEVSLAKAIVRILERNHYSADAVYDGLEALNYLECGGYGIGLSIAQAITAAHGGKITATTQDGQSLEISVQLPVN